MKEKNAWSLIAAIESKLDCFSLAGKKFFPQDFVEDLGLLRKHSEALICYPVRLRGVNSVATNPDGDGPRCVTSHFISL